MLDKDLVQYVQVFDYGVSCTFGDTLKWLLINIDRCVEIQKKSMRTKHKGAVSSTSEPRLIWVNMLQRPITTNKQIFALTKKFNTILEEVVSGDKRSHFMRVTIDHANDHFDHAGDITPRGFIALWKHIDTIMYDFEIGKDDLTPNPQQTSTTTTSDRQNLRHPSQFDKVPNTYR